MKLCIDDLHLPYVCQLPLSIDQPDSPVSSHASLAERAHPTFSAPDAVFLNGNAWKKKATTYVLYKRKKNMPNCMHYPISLKPIKLTGYSQRSHHLTSIT